jgi:hypothetical protein
MRNILKSHSGTHSGTGLERVKIDQKWQFWWWGGNSLFFFMRKMCVKMGLQLFI